MGVGPKDAEDSQLITVLVDAQRRGFLGPGPVVAHIVHARAYLEVWTPDDGPCLDLGSGGGVPGLVLARARPTTDWVLLDASAAKTSFLAAAVAALGLGSRVQVVTARAEELGRRVDHRGHYALVVARAFARPAVVAECAAPLLRVGGRLIVSEPPEDRVRWPPTDVAQLGLTVEQVASGRPRLAVLCQRRPTSEQFPRRVGIPTKRPLW